MTTSGMMYIEKSASRSFWSVIGRLKPAPLGLATCAPAPADRAPTAALTAPAAAPSMPPPYGNNITAWYRFCPVIFILRDEAPLDNRKPAIYHWKRSALQTEPALDNGISLRWKG